MKYGVSFLILLLGGVQGNFLTEQQSVKIMQFTKECMKETGVDEAIILKAQAGEYVDDSKLKKQLLCFNKKAGFQNDAGDLQIDFIKAQVNAVTKDESITNDIVSKCTMKKDNPEDTAFETVKCFHKLISQ